MFGIQRLAIPLYKANRKKLCCITKGNNLRLGLLNASIFPKDLWSRYVIYLCDQSEFNDISNPKRDYSNSNWTARIQQLKVLEDYILKGPFVLDWVSSSSAAVTSPLGGLQPQDNAQAFLYGFLK